MKTRVYHLGDYRRATLGVGVPAPSDYFHKDPTPETALLRQRILKRCREDIFRFLNNENGQVAIYDSVNPHHLDRQAIFTEFSRNECQVVFLESLVNDMELLNENVRNVKLSHPDFDNMDREEATALYLQRLDMAIPHFETLKYEDGLPWIKVIDAGKRVEMNDKGFTFIHKRIVLYLMNLHNKSKKIFFARAGKSSAEGPDLYRNDEDLSPEGCHYAKLLTQTLIEHRKEEHAAHCDTMDCEEEMKPLTVWTSQRVRTIETAQSFGEAGHTVLQRTQLAQLNPGQLEKMTDDELDKEYPGEREKHDLDPYHHRWPRAEVSNSEAVSTSNLTDNTLSRTTMSPSAWSQLSSSSSANNKTSSSSPMRPFSASSTATAWRALPPKSQSSSFHATRSSRSSQAPTRTRLAVSQSSVCQPRTCQLDLQAHSISQFALPRLDRALRCRAVLVRCLVLLRRRSRAWSRRR